VLQLPNSFLEFSHVLVIFGPVVSKGLDLLVTSLLGNDDVLCFMNWNVTAHQGTVRFTHGSEGPELGMGELVVVFLK
jgi:hypothetical protein